MLKKSNSNKGQSLSATIAGGKSCAYGTNSRGCQCNSSNLLHPATGLDFFEIELMWFHSSPVLADGS
jgi:hypothetical protein